MKTLKFLILIIALSGSCFSQEITPLGWSEDGRYLAYEWYQLINGFNRADRIISGFYIYNVHTNSRTIYKDLSSKYHYPEVDQSEYAEEPPTQESEARLREEIAYINRQKEKEQKENEEFVRQKLQEYHIVPSEIEFHNFPFIRGNDTIDILRKPLRDNNNGYILTVVHSGLGEQTIFSTTTEKFRSDYVDDYVQSYIVNPDTTHLFIIWYDLISHWETVHHSCSLPIDSGFEL